MLVVLYRVRWPLRVTLRPNRRLHSSPSIGPVLLHELTSFLIVQSFNQIEKAYGPTIRSSTTATCASVSKDERAAKRISDALGVATEMRAMRNYAGRALSPWLGDIMVSRQETPRPLLTPGEVLACGRK